MKDENSWRLWFACKNGDVTEVVTILSISDPDERADVNFEAVYKKTPLFVAIRIGRKDVVRVLVQQVDINLSFTDKDGLEPIHRAARLNRTEIISLLITAGADVNARTAGDEYGGYTPIHIAALAGHAEAIDALLLHGADPNLRDPFGSTALHRARGPLLILQLIGAGATIDAQDEIGKTALYYYAVAGQVVPVWYLVDAGADVNMAGEDGETPLYGAVRQGHVEVVSALIQAGADVTRRTRGGRTALMRARLGGKEDCAGLLLEAGAGERDTSGYMSMIKHHSLSVIKNNCLIS